MMMPVFFSGIRDYRYEIVVLFVVIVSTVAIVTLLQAPVFEADVSIIIDSEKRVDTSLEDPPQGTKGHSSSASTDSEDTDFNTAIKVLQGNVLAEQVIRSLGATRLFPELEQDTQGEEHFFRMAAYTFKQQLTVHPVDRTRIIKISFQHQEPEIAFKVVETLLSLFRKKYRTVQDPNASVQKAQLLLLLTKAEHAEYALSMFLLKNPMRLFQDRKENIAAQYDKKKTLLVT
ncbi:MAG: hypothetical protein D3924_17545, partial [Candidatus Electrothrix sp. AR4]|nr:hypothetical protein [Candidatus Electrothrix sp. AR4]